MVMAYVVMAYMVMAYLVMAYVVMAYMVMAYLVMAIVHKEPSVGLRSLSPDKATGLHIHSWPRWLWLIQL